MGDDGFRITSASHTAITQYSGFPHYGDEYKVMGSRPTASRMMADAPDRTRREGGFTLNLDYFTITASALDMVWQGGSTAIGPRLLPARRHSRAMRSPKDPPRRTITRNRRAMQAMFEEAFITLNALPKKER